MAASTEPLLTTSGGVCSPRWHGFFRNAVFLLFGCASLACGNGLYATRIDHALGRFEEAKALGAERTAPYDYYAAEVRIQEARRQAARAEYGTAATLARDAENYAALAVVKAQRARRGGSR